MESNESRNSGGEKGKTGRRWGTKKKGGEAGNRGGGYRPPQDSEHPPTGPQKRNGGNQKLRPVSQQIPTGPSGRQTIYPVLPIMPNNHTNATAATLAPQPRLLGAHANQTRQKSLAADCSLTGLQNSRWAPNIQDPVAPNSPDRPIIMNEFGQANAAAYVTGSRKISGEENMTGESFPDQPSAQQNSDCNPSSTLDADEIEDPLLEPIRDARGFIPGAAKLNRHLLPNKGSRVPSTDDINKATGNPYTASEWAEVLRKRDKRQLERAISKTNANKKKVEMVEMLLQIQGGQITQDQGVAIVFALQEKDFQITQLREELLQLTRGADKIKREGKENSGALADSNDASMEIKKNVDEQCKKSEESNRDAEGMLSVKQRELDAAAKELEGYSNCKQLLENAEGRYSSAEARLDTMDSKFTASQAELGNTKIQLEDLKNRHKTLGTEREKVEQSMNALVQSNDDLNKTNSALKAALDHKKGELKKLNETCAGQEQIIAKAIEDLRLSKEQCDHLESALTEKNQKVRELIRTSTNLNKANSSLEVAFDNKKGELKKLIETCASQEQLLAKALEDLRLSKEQCDHLESALTEKNQKVRELTRTTADLNEANSSLEVAFDHKKGELKKFIEACANQEQIIAKDLRLSQKQCEHLESTLMEKSQKIRELTRTNGDLNIDKGSLKKQMGELESGMIASDARMKEVEAKSGKEVTSLEGQLATANELIAELQLEKSAQTESLSQISQRLDEMSQELTDKDNAVKPTPDAANTTQTTICDSDHIESPPRAIRATPKAIADGGEIHAAEPKNLLHDSKSCSGGDDQSRGEDEKKMVVDNLIRPEGNSKMPESLGEDSAITEINHTPDVRRPSLTNKKGNSWKKTVLGVIGMVALLVITGLGTKLYNTTLPAVEYAPEIEPVKQQLVITSTKCPFEAPSTSSVNPIATYSSAIPDGFFASFQQVMELPANDTLIEEEGENEWVQAGICELKEFPKLRLAIYTAVLAASIHGVVHFMYA